MAFKSPKQARAAQFNFARFILRGIEAQIIMLHRHAKVIDRDAVRMMKEAIADCHDSMDQRMERDGLKPSGRR